MKYKNHRKGDVLNGALDKKDTGVQTQREEPKRMVRGERNTAQLTAILA